MVDFSFIVSLYVSDLLNVTIVQYLLYGTSTGNYRTSTSTRMVDFSFIVSLYVSDLLNVTISTVPVGTRASWLLAFGQMLPGTSIH